MTRIIIIKTSASASGPVIHWRADLVSGEFRREMSGELNGGGLIAGELAGIEAALLSLKTDNNVVDVIVSSTAVFKALAGEDVRYKELREAVKAASQRQFAPKFLYEKQEFTYSMGERLTDEAWFEMLKTKVENS